MKLKEKKFLIIGILLGTALTLTGFYLCSHNYVNSIKKEFSQKVNSNNELISIYIKNDSGEYILSEDTNFPTGMVLNEEKSYCINESTLDYDKITNKVDVITNGSENCYLYFDIKYGADTILENNGGIDAIVAKGEPTWDQSTTTNEGMYKIADDYGDSYYFRGAVDNNWLVFGKDKNNNDMYWRIVRINGNKSIRLIYTGITAPVTGEEVIMTGDKTFAGSSAFNSSYNQAEYVGYMYELGQRHGTSQSSTIKTVLETWYTENLQDEDEQIADAYFCYDRTVADGGFQDEYFGYIGGSYNTSETAGTGQSGMLFGAAGRLTASSTSPSPSSTSPSLICDNKLDQYTKDDEENGNGLLSQKVGLLTADETVLAGLLNGRDNNSNYLFRDEIYWVGSPFGFYSLAAEALVFNVSDGYADYNRSYLSRELVPAVSLSSSVMLEGNGTIGNPYKVI